MPFPRSRPPHQPNLIMRPAGPSLDGLRAFIDTIPDNSTIIEIGSYAGESAREFLRKASTLVCVDFWTPYIEINGPHVDGIANPTPAETAFDALLRQHPDRIRKLKLPSTTAAFLCPFFAADVIYIDAGHQAEQVAADIAAWLPKLRFPGILAGHDYDPARFPGVSKAVSAAFSHGVRLFADTTWAVRFDSHGVIQR